MNINHCQLNLVTKLYDKIIEISKMTGFSDNLSLKLINIGNKLINILLDQTNNRGIKFYEIENYLNQYKLESLNEFNNTLKECINDSQAKITYKKLKLFISLFSKYF